MREIDHYHLWLLSHPFRMRMHITYPPGGGAQHKPLATISNPFGVKNYISIPERYHFVRLIAIHLLHLFFKDHQGRAMINRPYGTEEVASISQRPSRPGYDQSS